MTADKLGFIELLSAKRLKVSLKPLGRLVGAAAIGGRLRRGETLLSACSFLPSFFLCAFCHKEKSG